MLKLYGSLTSPYARKARILVHEKKIDCEFVVEDPWAAESKIPQMNPLGKVPVLQVADDMFIFESQLVMLYLNNLDGRPWGPKDPAGYWRCEWWQALGQGILDAGIARRMEVTRPEDKQMPEKVAREEARIQRALDAAEEAFKGGEFLVSTRLSMADIVFGVALQYTDFRYTTEWRAAHPKLAQYVAGLAARPSFVDTQPPGFTPPAA